MNIVLVGFMGVGKTEVGRALAGRLHMPFIDIDELLEQLTGFSIPEVFALLGESKFRDIESEVIKSLTSSTPPDGCVISCGGGVVLREENITRLKVGSIVVLLTAPINLIGKRIRGSSRPLASSNWAKLLSERNSRYVEAADITVHTGKLGITSITNKIIRRLKKDGHIGT